MATINVLGEKSIQVIEPDENTWKNSVYDKMEERLDLNMLQRAQKAEWRWRGNNVEQKCRRTGGVDAGKRDARKRMCFHKRRIIDGAQKRKGVRFYRRKKY